jgi:hypothetical protein
MASQLGPYSLDGIAYRSSDETPTPQSAYSNQQEFSATGNPLSFHEGEVTGDGSHCLGQRVEKVNYHFSICGLVDSIVFGFQSQREWFP